MQESDRRGCRHHTEPPSWVENAEVKAVTVYDLATRTVHEAGIQCALCSSALWLWNSLKCNDRFSIYTLTEYFSALVLYMYNNSAIRLQYVTILGFRTEAKFIMDKVVVSSFG